MEEVIAPVVETQNASVSPEVEAQVTETAQTLVDVPTSWRDALREDLRDNKQLSKFDSLDKLAEAYDNASKLIGKRMQDVDPAMLKTVFSPEEFAEYTKARGVPESAEGYAFESIVPEALLKNEATAATIKQFQSLAHEMGLPAEQATKLLQFEMEAQTRAQEQFKQENFAVLSNTYGKDLTRADQVATDGARALGGDDLVNLLKETGLSSHPVIFKALLSAGERMKEDKIPFTGNAVAPGADSAKAGLASLMKDPVFARQYREGHPDAIAKMNELYSRFS